MQLPHALGSAVLVALLPWTPALQEGAARPQPTRTGTLERQALMAEQIVGAWQLVEARIGGSVIGGLSSAGYLLVQADYLAIELHLQMPSSYSVDSEQPFFQSGIRRWRFDGELRLQTSALIGCTNLTEFERWDFDPPGTRTTLEMVLNEESLVLEQPGESRLVFRKLPRMPFPGDPADALEDERRRKEQGRR